MSTCRELGVAFVAYSPLGRGFLTGKLGRVDTLAPSDFRRHAPRLQPGNLDKNLQIVAVIEALALEKKTTAAALALAWVLSCGEHVISIPGTTKAARVEENMRALSIELSATEFAQLDAVAPPGAAAGDRYHAAGMQSIDHG